MLEDITKNKTFFYLLSLLVGGLVCVIDNHYMNIQFEWLVFIFCPLVFLLVGGVCVAVVFAVADALYEFWCEGVYAKILIILGLYVLVYFYGFK